MIAVVLASVAIVASLFGLGVLYGVIG